MAKVNRGFTLIELLVVLAIIGILAGLGLVSYSNSMKSARDGKRKADLLQVAGALEIYRADKGTYPMGDVTTGFLMYGCGTTCPLTVCVWGGAWTCGESTYMPKLPGVPNWDDPSYYHYMGGGNEYTLAACLEIASDPQGATGGWCPSGIAYWIKNPQ